MVRDAMINNLKSEREAGKAFSGRVAGLARRSRDGEWSVPFKKGKEDIILTGEFAKLFPMNAQLIVKGDSGGQGRVAVNDYLLNVYDRGPEEIRFLKKELSLICGFTLQWIRRWPNERIEKIVEEPERIKLEFMVGDGQVTSWKEALVENKIRRVLRAAGVGKDSVKEAINYAKSPQKLWDILTSDPWELSLNVDRVSFLSMDLIASTFKLNQTTSSRLGAGLAYLLRKLGEENGGTIQPKERALAAARELLRMDPAAILQGAFFVKAVVEVEDGWLGEEKIVGIENEIAKRIERIRKETVVPISLESAQKVGRERGLDFAQGEAVSLLLNSPIAILTGGPGTGKTTVLGTVVQILKAQKKKVMLMAPTGKAASRLARLTEETASTIHRALGNKNRPASDTWIVDESSMISSELMAWLLREAEAEGVQVILVGDPDQLPPIDQGIPFCDLIGGEIVPRVSLNTIYRQEEETGIPKVAAIIRGGKVPGPEEEGPATGVSFIKMDGIEEIQKIALNKSLEFREKYGEEESVLLSSVNKGEIGVYGLGERLQEACTGWVPEQIAGHGRRWRVGDPVLHTKNDYGAFGGTLYQGTMGKIINIENGFFDGEGKVNIAWEDGIVRPHEVEEGEIENVLLAYALTVHRSQGSEYDGVVVVLPTRGVTITGRELLYTAITRARKEVVVIYQGGMLQAAIRKVQGKRETALQRFLKAIKREGIRVE